jgi:hypothetical protein
VQPVGEHDDTRDDRVLLLEFDRLCEPAKDVVERFVLRDHLQHIGANLFAVLHLLAQADLAGRRMDLANGPTVGAAERAKGGFEPYVHAVATAEPIRRASSGVVRARSRQLTAQARKVVRVNEFEHRPAEEIVRGVSHNRRGGR